MPGFLFDMLGPWLAIFIATGAIILAIDVVGLDRARAHSKPSQAVPGVRRSWRLHWRWLLAGVVCMLLIGVAGIGLNTVGSDPLVARGPATGAGPLYLGTAPATYGGKDAVTFAAVPGGMISVEFTLANTGDFAVKLAELRDPITGGVEWDDALFETGGLSPAGQVGGVSVQPFEIPPHSSVPVELSLVLRSCPEWSPTPTLPPDRSPSPEAAVALTGATGWTQLENISFGYEKLGFGQVSTLELPATIDLAMADRSGCTPPQDLPSESPPSTQINPSGPFVTPVTSFTFP